MTRTAGIDIGSRTTKVAVLEDGRLVHSRVVDTGTDPLARARIADKIEDLVIPMA